jgi:hypothetical protein
MEDRLAAVRRFRVLVQPANPNVGVVGRWVEGLGLLGLDAAVVDPRTGMGVVWLLAPVAALGAPSSPRCLCRGIRARGVGRSVHSRKIRCSDARESGPCAVSGS